MTPHFLTGAELTAAELEELLARAEELKREPLRSRALEGRSVALIFEKPSTRTRLSFEVGVHELGGQPLILRSDEMQLSRGRGAARHGARSSAGTSRPSACARARRRPCRSWRSTARSPSINMLSPDHHPCQALADLLTLREAYGTLAGLRVAYVGDGNNVARSLAMLGTLAGLQVAIASPPGYSLEGELSLLGRGERERDAARGSPRGRRGRPSGLHRRVGEHGRRARGRPSAAARWPPTSVDDELLDAAAEGAFAMHDLPAHPGEEISAEVLYGERQRIWEQAENRRHAQKALLELLLSRRRGRGQR